MNKDNITMQKGISFLKLIENNKILVPKIQRDYAQGRLDDKATEIRNNFLNSIFDTLTANNSDPLLLDFIYGSTQNSVFTPLDGQQRLTTLFLLHWYNIPQDKKFLLFIKDGNSCYSRFSYETRISSKDFCNALVTYSCNDLKSMLIEVNKTNNDSQKHLSDIIKNQSWFLWTWRKDPTIKAMLVMLDETDRRTALLEKEQQSGIWEQLENSKIIFDLLPLEQFSLTDELYVKMNARGKELSPFDIFKSTLEEQMRLNGVKEDIQNEWRKNVDSNWIDIFWNKLAKPHINEKTKSEDQIQFVNSVENGYLRFFKRMMVFHLFTKDNPFECDWKNENINKYIPFEYDENNILNKLRDFSVQKNILTLMPLFNKTKFFNEDFFQLIIGFFNSFIYHLDSVKHDGTELIRGVSFESKNNLFESFIAESIDYDTRVQFFAIYKFFNFNSSQKVCENEELINELNAWMRVIRNLSTNTNSYFYNGFDDFLKSLKTIEVWTNSVYSSEGGHNIIEYIKEQPSLDGFNREQLNEEKIKAELMACEEWKTTIIETEEHPYFLGQIRFLLEWSKVEEKYDFSLFNNYKSLVISIFDKDGLKSDLAENYVFRNALMTVSDMYLLNNCFMQNTSKHRDCSWKRYLRASDKSTNIKLLIDSYHDENKSFKDFCIEQKSNLPSDWRRFFIEKPEIYNELYDHKLSWWNWDAEEICLLSKTRWSSKHKELKTYYLHKKYKSNGDYYLDSTHESHPFSAVFKRNENKEFSVKFIPKRNDGLVEGQYVVSSNYDSEIGELQFNDTNKRWESYLNSTQFEDVEKMINTLNSK